MNVKYKVERRMCKLSTGWFTSKTIPMWCLVEYGSVYVCSYGGGSSVDIDGLPYEKVVLKSEDKNYILQELANFTGRVYEC